MTERNATGKTDTTTKASDQGELPFRTPKPHESEPPPEGERVEQPGKDPGHRHRPTPGGAGFSGAYVSTPVSDTNEDESLVKPKDGQR